MILEGTVLAGPDYTPTEGRVVVEDGTIEAVEEAPTDSTDIVLPAFVNAHTHVGDSIAKEAGGGRSLDDLVAPPDGLKHRLLDAADTDSKVRAMARSLAYMEATGTGVAGLASVGVASAAEFDITGHRDDPAIEIVDGAAPSRAFAAPRDSDPAGRGDAVDREFARIVVTHQRPRSAQRQPGLFDHDIAR